MRINKKDILVTFVIASLLLFSTIAVKYIFHDNAIFIILILSNLFLTLILFELYRRILEKTEVSTNLQNTIYSQTEALLSIINTIKPDFPLPATREWAASPDLLKKLVEVIYRDKPKLVMEASSGVSTLIVAYCLKRLGCGKVISLEHDEVFARHTNELIALHGLSDVAEVVHAPLVNFDINDTNWLWYDYTSLKFDTPINLLIVDGPPASTQKLARYPALPLLYKHLNTESIIILDDGAREEEKFIVEMWKKEFSDVSDEFLNFEKGAFYIKKRQN